MRSKKVIRPDPCFVNFDSSGDDDEEESNAADTPKSALKDTPKRREGGVRLRPKRVQFGDGKETTTIRDVSPAAAVSPPPEHLLARRHTLASIEISKEEEEEPEVEEDEDDEPQLAERGGGRRRSLLVNSVSVLQLRARRRNGGGGVSLSNQLSELTSNLGRLRVRHPTNIPPSPSPSLTTSSGLVSCISPFHSQPPQQRRPLSLPPTPQQQQHCLQGEGGSSRDRDDGVFLSAADLSHYHHNSMLELSYSNESPPPNSSHYFSRPHALSLSLGPCPSSLTSSSSDVDSMTFRQTASLSDAGGGAGRRPSHAGGRRQLPKVPEHAAMTETAAKLVSPDD